jgi:hypothetical protein
MRTPSATRLPRAHRPFVKPNLEPDGVNSDSLLPKRDHLLDLLRRGLSLECGL